VAGKLLDWICDWGKAQDAGDGGVEERGHKLARPRV